jgi:hypothetical protein
MIYTRKQFKGKCKSNQNAPNKAEVLIIGMKAGFSRTHYAKKTTRLAYDDAETFNTLLL